MPAAWTLADYVTCDDETYELWVARDPDQCVVVPAVTAGLSAEARLVRLRRRRQMLAGRCTCTPRIQQGQDAATVLYFHEAACNQHATTMRAV